MRPLDSPDFPDSLDQWGDGALGRARELSWSLHGKKVVFYLPGMFVRDGVQGEYPAFSVTGNRCAQGCAHCAGNLLRGMPDVSTPDLLLSTCRRLAAEGAQGVLLSGGCDGQGRVPWADFADAIAEVKEETGLFVSVHCGMLDSATARALKKAGVDQALIDVIGSAETYTCVYHLPNGPELLERSLEALCEAELPVVPHIVTGLHFGRLLGENRALKLLARHPPSLLVVVACMPLPGTEMADVKPPTPQAVCGVIIRARELMPETEISLGCARPRKSAPAMEALALLAGVNRMALPSDETLALAGELGLEAQFGKTCCSVRLDAARQSGTF